MPGVIGLDQIQHGSLVNFIWTIADDVLRDYYVRGKYRDVILPMTVIRRLIPCWKTRSRRSWI